VAYLGTIFQPHKINSPADTQQYQPEFPLVYDGTYGPYKPITNELLSYQRDFEYLLLTNPGEWPMNPEIGVGIRHYLFEFHESPEIHSFGAKIQRQLSKYLPNIILESVDWVSSEDDIDRNYATVIIKYYIAGAEDLMEMRASASEDGKVNIERIASPNLRAALERRMPLQSDQVTI
tara:strand:- start:218 stop:748 length:531 start_codon:yes stop_codon:yes gene_type:complete